MAAKIKIAKIANGMRPLNRPAPPSASAKLAGLYLLALRSHLAQNQTAVPRRKLKVTIPITSAENHEGIPEIVRIRHSPGVLASSGGC